jgi:hypothetical protein
MQKKDLLREKRAFFLSLTLPENIFTEPVTLKDAKSRHSFAEFARHSIFL